MIPTEHSKQWITSPLRRKLSPEKLSRSLNVKAAFTGYPEITAYLRSNRQKIPDAWRIHKTHSHPSPVLDG